MKIIQYPGSSTNGHMASGEQFLSQPYRSVKPTFETLPLEIREEILQQMFDNILASRPNVDEGLDINDPFDREGAQEVVNRIEAIICTSHGMLHSSVRPLQRLHDAVSAHRERCQEHLTHLEEVTSSVWWKRTEEERHTAGEEWESALNELHRAIDDVRILDNVAGELRDMLEALETVAFRRIRNWEDADIENGTIPENKLLRILLEWIGGPWAEPLGPLAEELGWDTYGDASDEDTDV